MSYQRKRRRPMAEINVVPYIDVMLVLLVIFMVTAPLIAQGVKVDLPQGEADPLVTDAKPPIVASVTSAGEYHLDIGDGKDLPVELMQLQSLVADQLAKSPDTPVVVRGDRHVDYEQIVYLMVALQNAGAPSVGLMTDLPER